MPSNVAHKKIQEKINNCMWNFKKKQQEDEVYINTHRPQKCRRNRCDYTCGRLISSSRSMQVQLVWSEYLLAENGEKITKT